MKSNFPLLTASVGIFAGLLFAGSLAAKEKALKTKLVEMIPGGKITVDLVLGLGFKRSDQVGLIKKQFDLVSVSQAETRAQYRIGRNINSSLAFSSDKNERQPNFPSPESNIAQQFTTSYRHGFENGLSLDASANFQNVQTVWPQSASPMAAAGGSEVNYAQTELTVGVEQRLWRNAFGEAIQASLEADYLDTDITAADVDSQLSDWGVQLVNIFYEAWLAQRSVDAQMERLQTQKRLAKISRVSQQRGTLDQADVLNIESQVLSAEQAFEQSQKTLQDVWRNLVVALKLPEEFLKLNPEDIPIATEDYSSAVADFCGVEALDVVKSDKNPQVKTLMLQKNAAGLRLRALSSQEDPDLFLRLAYTANGLDNDRFSETVYESIGGSHPGFQAVLGLNIDLDNHALKAQRKRQETGLSQLELNLSAKRDQLRVDWMNRCREVDRLKHAIDSQQRILTMNRRRQKLEEDRFRLGRVDVINVIQASNDLITARLSLQRAQGELSKNYWILKSLHGELPSRLQTLANSPMLERF